MYTKILNLAKILNCEVKLDEPMKKHNTFRIGGNADVFITIFNLISLQTIMKSINEQRLPSFILGKGSNLLVADDGFRGIVLCLAGEFNEIKKISRNTIQAGAGATFAKLSILAVENSLSGLEFGFGIPGTIGGAIFMNAGAYGGEISQVIKNCTSITPEGNIITLDKKDMELSYRNSIYSKNKHIIISAEFELKKGEKDKIKAIMHENMTKRKSKQPLEMPSAGSTFKRPNGCFVGPLIEKNNLKGKNIGGAKISEKHAGFVINYNNATCQNVVDLIHTIQKIVLENDNICLEAEVKTLGNTGL